MFCRNCGISLPENSKFCFACGTKVFVPEIISEGGQIQKTFDAAAPDNEYSEQTDNALADNSEADNPLDSKQTELNENRCEFHRSISVKKRNILLCVLAVIFVLGFVYYLISFIPKSIIGDWTITNSEDLEIETFYDGNRFAERGNDLKLTQIEFFEGGICRMGGENGLKKDYYLENDSLLIKSAFDYDAYNYEISGLNLILCEKNGKKRKLVYLPTKIYEKFGDTTMVDLFASHIVIAVNVLVGMGFVIAFLIAVHDYRKSKEK